MTSRSEGSRGKFRILERQVGTVFGDEEMGVLAAMLSSGENLSWGPQQQAFEKEFREFCAARYAVSVCTGTAALEICAKLLRMRAGDEVVCTPQSFWATIAALVERRVRIRFADIDPETLNVTPKSIERSLTARTRAIYIVHYGGNPLDVSSIHELARQRGIPVVEDCAHAVGASYRGVPIGGGDLCIFSFQSLKNMSTLGEGGMLTTNNPEWAEQAARLRVMGATAKTQPRTARTTGPFPDRRFVLPDYSNFPPLSKRLGREEVLELQELGTKSYLSALQCAVGRVQLRRLQDLNGARRRVARRYTEGIRRIPGLQPVRVANEAVSAWHLYTCFVDPDSGVDRDALLFHLQESGGIQLALRYWPLHLNPILAHFGHGLGEAPVCERVWFKSQVNLPISPVMSDSEVDIVLEALDAGMRACRHDSAATCTTSP